MMDLSVNLTCVKAAVKAFQGESTCCVLVIVPDAHCATMHYSNYSFAASCRIAQLKFASNPKFKKGLLDILCFSDNP